MDESDYEEDLFSSPTIFPTALSITSASHFGSKQGRQGDPLPVLVSVTTRLQAR